MINKINQLNSDSDLSARKAHTAKTQHGLQEPKPAQSAKHSVSAVSNSPRSAAGLSAALGLPQDKLSSSIISFVKFFSLPLKLQLLTNLRRYAFVPSTSKAAASKAVTANASTSKIVSANTNTAENTNASMPVEKTRLAFSLSAAAAESKGVELTPKGLESYAEAVDPDSRRQDEESKRRRRNREQDEQEEKTSLKTESVKKHQHGESSHSQLFTADSLKKIFLEYAEQNPLIEILNRLPCKNGQRWIVLPFDFDEGNKNYSVSMRILLDDKHSLNRAVCMALDIIESENIEPDTEHDTQERSSGKANNERRWLFVAESVNDKSMRVSVYLQGELSQKNYSRFKSELSTLFNIPSEHINIKNRTEPFSYESSFADNFSLVDEAV